MSRFTTTRQVRNVKGVMHLFQNRRTMWMMLKEVFRGHYRMSLMSSVIFILGVLYVVFPFDLVTDFIPVLGWVDDGFVAYLVIKRLQTETQRYIRFKASQRRCGH